MYRQIIGYFPANVIPAIVAMTMVYAYTRLLSPSAFGSYSYVFSAVLILQTSLFYALPIAVMRFFPAAARDGRQAGLLKEAYIIFYAICLLIGTCGACAGLLLPLSSEYRLAAWLALPLLLFRSLVQLNQAVNRSAGLMRRFNIVESLHSILGFGFSIAALSVVGHGPEAIVLGLLVAAIACALIDFRLLMSPLPPTPVALNTKELVRLVEYSWPLVAVAATAVILQNCDRFLLGSLDGAGALGIYAVAYNLVERPTTLICSSISTATFPLVVQVLENKGREAARLQSGRNGIALLALILPACIGLALTADNIAASLVGSDFRLGVAALLPIMALTAFARGMRSHFIDHVFHLSGRPLMMLWTYGPATIVNIVLNIYVVPRYGMIGAAWMALLCQSLTLVSGWALGRSLFPIWLPIGQVIVCVLAAIPMSIALASVHFPRNWAGLFEAVAVGGGIYIISAIVLNVGEVRSIARISLLRKSERLKMPVLMD